MKKKASFVVAPQPENVSTLRKTIQPMVYFAVQYAKPLVVAEAMHNSD